MQKEIVKNHLKTNSMKNLFTKMIACCLLMSMTVSIYANSGDDHFCLNADVPEAQMNFKAMCLTAPVIFCPPHTLDVRLTIRIQLIQVHLQ